MKKSVKLTGILAGMVVALLTACNSTGIENAVPSGQEMTPTSEVFLPLEEAIPIDGNQSGIDLSQAIQFFVTY